MLELDRDGVGERKIILKLRSRTPSRLQDCASLPALLGLTAESGLNRLMDQGWGEGQRPPNPQRIPVDVVEGLAARRNQKNLMAVSLA
jgi:hypothetical protein